MTQAVLQEFVIFANSNGDEDWTIFLCSGGGLNSVLGSMLQIINNHAERTTLIMKDGFSSAFLLFAKAKCKRLLTKGAMGLHHLSYRQEVAVDSRGKIVYTFDRAMAKNMRAAEQENNEINDLLTKKERKKYFKGMDVHLSTKRLREIFPDVTMQE